MNAIPVSNPWIRRSYCCMRTNACNVARHDRVVSAQAHAEQQGRCAECGEPLHERERVDLRLRWAIAGLGGSAALGFAGWRVSRWLFPDPLTQVAFSRAATESTDDAGRVEVLVSRDGALDQPAIVRFRVADGTAKAGQDYTLADGELRFVAGERQRAIGIVVLPDASFQKPRRFFTLTLVNVQGQPQHVVHLLPRPTARTDALVAERAVRAGSVVAKDVADLVVRQRMLDLLMAASRDRSGEFAAYRETLASVSGNLTRARESYAQALRDLQQQPPAAVLDAMDRVTADLEARKFEQQAKALRIMKRHFGELLDHRDADMDRWARELSTVIPRVMEPAAPGTKDATAA